MSNEILRHKNKSNVDESVSFASFGEKPVKRKEKNTNTLLGFFTSEKVNFNEKLALEKSIPVEKPKLYEPLSLMIELITIAILLTYFCISVNNLFFMVVLIAFFSLIVPAIMVFFFYRLNTRWKIKISLIVKLFTLGIGAYLLLDVIFDKIVEFSLSYANLLTPIKSVVEIFVVIVIIGLVVKGVKEYNAFSVLLIACIISAGFSTCKSMVEMFEVMFVRVQISNNGITSAVGAIINNSDSVKLSVTALVNNFLNISVFNSAMFISLTVINGFILRYLFFNKTHDESVLELLLLFVFTMLIMAFSSLDSSIRFLQVIYTSICVLATGYALYQVIEHCIKQENYI